MHLYFCSGQENKICIWEEEMLSDSEDDEIDFFR